MKRISISIIMLMCLFLSVYAKDGSRHDDFWETWPYRFEVRAGWGGFPLMDNILYLSDYKENIYGPGYDIPPGLEGLYAPQQGAVYASGQFFGEFSWNVRKWLAVTAGLYIDGMRSSMIDPDNGEVLRPVHGVSVTVLPSLRFYWANLHKARFYSDVSVGLNAGLGIYRESNKDFNIVPAFQIAPIGVTIGRKVFFFAEFSIGTTCLGGKTGIGYRF